MSDLWGYIFLIWGGAMFILGALMLAYAYMLVSPLRFPPLRYNVNFLGELQQADQQNQQKEGQQ